MNKLSVKQLVLNFVFYQLLQLPLLYRLILFDRAFGFFYVGFLLLLPVGLSRIYLMLIGFLSGLLIDVFSNTPGMHALSCVLLMFVRNIWLSVVDDDWRELGNLNVLTMKFGGFLAFVMPLVFLHHFVLFTVENGGLHLFGMLMSKVFSSTIISTLIIFALNLVLIGKRRRA